MADAGESNRMEQMAAKFPLIAQNSGPIADIQNNTEEGLERDDVASACVSADSAPEESSAEETPTYQILQSVSGYGRLIDNAPHLRPIAGLLKAMIKDSLAIMTEIRVHVLSETPLHCYDRIRKLSTTLCTNRLSSQWEYVSYKHARDANAFGFLFQFLDLMVSYALLRMGGADYRRYFNVLLAMKANAMGIDKRILRGLYKALVQFVSNSMGELNKMYRKAIAARNRHSLDLHHVLYE